MSTNPEHTNGLAKIDTDGSIESDCPSISSKEEDEKVFVFVVVVRFNIKILQRIFHFKCLCFSHVILFVIIGSCYRI